MMIIRSATAPGGSPFLFFWSGPLPDPLSNFYPSPLVYQGREFPTVEHGFQWAKAQFFGDLRRADLIETDNDPEEAKWHGGMVEPFDSKAWALVSMDVMEELLWLKFSSSSSSSSSSTSSAASLGQILMDTQEYRLGNASPGDCTWGMGLSAHHPGAPNPKRWWGRNLLGVLLEKTRFKLAQELAASKGNDDDDDDDENEV